MSEVKKGNGLVYKNHPLRRVDNLIYYCLLYTSDAADDA